MTNTTSSKITNCGMPSNKLKNAPKKTAIEEIRQMALNIRASKEKVETWPKIFDQNNFIILFFLINPLLPRLLLSFCFLKVYSAVF